MIYRSVSAHKEIRQGDIFHNLPFVRFDLEDLNVISKEESVEQKSWREITEERTPIIAELEKNFAIVITQDCDCLRNTYISLDIIRPLERNITSAKVWMKTIIKINQKEPSKMYLPPDSNFNIPQRMIIDFSTTFHLLRENINSNKDLRICRLNNEALEHFQEKLANYFRRYASDEYYPLNLEEMDEYENWRGETFPRRKYQKP